MLHGISKLGKKKAEIRTSSQRSRRFSKTAKTAILRTESREMCKGAICLMMDFTGIKRKENIPKLETRFRYVNTYRDLR